MFPSIKSRLIAWVFSLFLFLFAGLGIFLYNRVENTLIDSVDGHLHSEVQFIVGLIEIEDGYHEVDLEEVRTGEYAVPLSGHYYQIISADGRIMARSPSLSTVDARLPLPDFPAPSSLYETISGPDRGPLRMLTESFDLKYGTITIQAGDNLEETYKLIASFRTTILFSVSAFFAISITGIALISKLSLKRLDDFSETVGRITDKNLMVRLEERDVESEIRLLVAGFNTMMDRIEDAFLSQKQFMSDASHELRTPTSVIKSYCDITLGRKRSSDEYKDALEKISSAVNRMAVMIDRIMEVARLEREVFSLKMGEADLREVLEEAVRLLYPKALETGIKINISGDNIKVHIDKERLFEALINIIDNAVKYNKEGIGSVDIKTSSAGGDAVVTVSDTGIGIPEDQIGRIFDRFYRVDESRGAVKGSGLGLSIARGIVEAHGGRIQVESAKGKGTVFTIKLPLS